MNVKQAYNNWADQYDTNDNKTRDLESVAFRQTLSALKFNNCLELGCGTGKNTEWISTKAESVTAVDFSEEMPLKAKEKIKSKNVHFCQADITNDWNFINKQFDLITFSLVLEHIENLDTVFQKVEKAIASNGYVYIGELHPFKQYTGTKARFETESGQEVLTCYNHHVSDFTDAAIENGLEILTISEYFDDGDRKGIPRILALVLRKKP